jgi:4-hydroxy-tetrahydrodipicolinate synthase
MLRKEWSTRLEGALIPAVPVPLTADGRTHVQAQEAYVQHMAAQPIGGVAVWAHTGRGLQLPREQRNAVMRSWRSGLGKSVPIVAGAGGPGALRMAEDALANGADMLMAYAPAFLRDRPEAEILAYHQELAGLGAPLILFYLYEEAGGISYSPALLDQLFAIAGVVAIKMATLDSVMTFQEVAKQIATSHPDVLLITGEDRFLGYSLMCGGRAALVGMGAACTAMQADLLQAYRSQDFARFMALNRKVDAYAQVTFSQPMEGYIQRMLWSLALQGIIPAEATCDPWGPAVSRQEIAELERVMQAIGEVR